MKRIISIITVMMLSCICITGCIMTDEERAEYVKSHTYEYEVLSVNHYMKPITGRSRYHFTYLDTDGKLHEVKDFMHIDNGIQQICISNENKYIVEYSDIGKREWLYLTKETLSK